MHRNDIGDDESGRHAILREQVRRLREISKNLAERSFYHYFRRAFLILEPGRTFVDNWHIHLLAEVLQAFVERKIRRLIINISPRTTKSTLSSISLPPWSWKKDPRGRWITSSYAQELATQFSLARRRLMESEPQSFKFLDDENRKTSMQNNQLGTQKSVSTGGTVSGVGADYILCDDPQDAQKGESKADREEANRHVKYLFGTRLNDRKRGCFALIQQRLHAADQTQTMVQLWEDSGLEYTHIVIPARFSKDTEFVFPISGKKIFKPEGSLMWPERLGERELMESEKALGPYGYSAQYLQSPSPEGGGRVKRSWFAYYEKLPDKKMLIGNFWDTAMKDKEMNDYNCGLQAAFDGENVYILDRMKGRWLYPELKNNVIILYNSRKAHVISIEDKVTGTPLIQELRRSEKKLPVNAYKPDGDKVYRLSLATPWIAAAKIFLPIDASWVKDFLDTIEEFPKGAHDDDVDALSHMILWYMKCGFKPAGGKDEEKKRSQNVFSPSLNAKRSW